MEHSTIQQAVDLIGKSGNVVIVLPRDPSTDAIASSLALFLVLEKEGKKVKVVCNEFNLPPSHQFLPKSKEILTDLTALRKFIITLDCTRTKVQELSYDISAKDQLNIFITPKDGFFEPRDVTTSASSYEYDLIVVIDAPDLESLGKVYDNNTEFFYHTPIINIDHNPANEYFGQINVVDLVATSTSEIIFEMLRSMKSNSLDEYIATSLLTGIITKTKSFQSASVTPRSLAVSSLLVESGARRDDIIKHLYRTKSINTLKLWGRALARLKTGHNDRIVWSLLNRQDFTKSGASESELEGVIDELIVNTPHAEAVLILYESGEKGIKGVASTAPSIDGLAVFKQFQPTGTRDFTRFVLPYADLLQAEQAMIDTVKPYIGVK
ncbi:MAG: DHH family phosphoesterase [Patescibacteria group bacterium]|nr:DHH family phosphoesterase [Patescibacteria group bacterium]MDD5715984.1 DHH family phosphoesterase [Patescibacteria group bacterium]